MSRIPHQPQAGKPKSPKFTTDEGEFDYKNAIRSIRRRQDEIAQRAIVYIYSLNAVEFEACVTELTRLETLASVLKRSQELYA